MIPFAAYTAADSQCAGQAPKIISSRAVEGSQPNLIHVIAPPQPHLDRFSSFARLTNVTNQQTKTQTMLYSVCSNRLHGSCDAA